MNKKPTIQKILMTVSVSVIDGIADEVDDIIGALLSGTFVNGEPSLVALSDVADRLHALVDRHGFEN